MRPDDRTNNAFVYCLAVAAQRYGIRIIFTAAMSNHHHTGIEDPDGNYPAFLEHFHKLFAKCQNTLRGRWENFWSSEQTSVVRLAEGDDIMAKMTYALSNPVKDGLVEKAHHWPGVSSLDALAHAKALVAWRPKHFFREEGIMPESVSLPLSRPREFKDVPSKEFAARVVKAIQVAEENVRAERASFMVGRTTNFQVMQRQTDLIEARLRRGQAVADYHKAVAQLQFLSGDILSQYRVNVRPRGDRK